MTTILLVDDEIKLRAMLRMYLEQEGYQVVEARNGREALMVVRQVRPDLAVVDLMMPEMDGLDFLRALANERAMPVLFLTAKIDEQDKVLGLELGADDYVTKPFNVNELLARLRAILRRSSKAPLESALLRAADIVLDRTTISVRVAERPIELTRSEFEILATLMAAPGHVFSRLDLLDRVSGAAYDGYERTIDVHIRNLRTKLAEDPRQPRYIETVYGMGYRFRAAE